MKIARALIFGRKTGLETVATGMRNNSTFVGDVSEEGVLGQNRPDITPGFIAWVSIVVRTKGLSVYSSGINLTYSQARYILSNDTEFTSTGIGANSGFLYFDDFNDYKKIIIENIHNQWYSNLMGVWIAEVYNIKASDAQQQPGPEVTHSHRRQGVTEIMAAIAGRTQNAVDSETDSGDGNGDEHTSGFGQHTQPIHTSNYNAEEDKSDSNDSNHDMYSMRIPSRAQSSGLEDLDLSEIDMESLKITSTPILPSTVSSSSQRMQSPAPIATSSTAVGDTATINFLAGTKKSSVTRGKAATTKTQRHDTVSESASEPAKTGNVITRRTTRNTAGKRKAKY